MAAAVATVGSHSSATRAQQHWYGIAHEWDGYDLPRHVLRFPSGERFPLSAGTWNGSVAPRWRSTLVDLLLATARKDDFGFISSTKEKTLEGCADTSNGPVTLVQRHFAGQSLDFSDEKLAEALIELLNAVLFSRITSQQALECLREVWDTCAKALRSRLEPTRVKGTEGGPSVTSVSDTGSPAVKGPVDEAPVSPGLTGSDGSERSSVRLVLESTALRESALDALRWTVEYGVGLVESQLHAEASTPRVSGSTGVGSSGGNKASRPYEWIVPVLELVEKAGILTSSEIIGNCPYSQLDLVAYYNARDGLSLMKLGVRLRTKEIFTLPVYNLEAENPCGYARLHVRIQQFLAQSVSRRGSPSSSDPLHFGVWRGENSVELRCPVVKKLAEDLERLIVEFQLCTNRVVQVLLLYLAHFLFHAQYALLDVILYLSSPEKLREMLFFQLCAYEEAAARQCFVSRDVDLWLTQEYAMYPPLDNFYHLCAYLVMEGLLSLPAVWNALSPSDADLLAWVQRCNASDAPGSGDSLAPSPPDAKEESRDATPHVDKEDTPEIALNRLKSPLCGRLRLIAALIDLNAWAYAEALLMNLAMTVPQWSLHLAPQIVTALGHLMSWLVQPLVPKPIRGGNKRRLIRGDAVVPEGARTRREREVKGEPVCPTSDAEGGVFIYQGRAVGRYACPYMYGLCRFGAMEKDESEGDVKKVPPVPVGLKPVTSLETYTTVVVPLLKILGPSLGTLPPHILEQAIDVFTVVLKEGHAVSARPTSGRSKEDIFVAPRTPPVFLDVLARVFFPTLSLIEPRFTITEKLWGALTCLTLQERFATYADFFYIVREKCPLIAAAAQAVRRTVSRELKRVTADQRSGGNTTGSRSGSNTLFASSSGGASVMGEIVVRARTATTYRERAVMDSLSKLCATNPFEVMDVILHQVEMFDSMLIQVIINYLSSLPLLCCDVVVFLVVERQQSLEPLERGVWAPTTARPKKLRNMAHFVARFLRRFPTTDVRPLVVSAASRIVQETFEVGYPDRLSGKYSDIVYLEELITWMGGIPTFSTEELSKDQIACAGAGPNLRLMIVVDESRREELYRPGYSLARSNLREALMQPQVFHSFLLGLSKLKLEVQYDCQLLCKAKSLQLRSVASLTDEIQLSLLQVLEFLVLPESDVKLHTLSAPDITALSKAPKDFAAVLPSLSDLMRFCEPATVWLLVRATLAPLYNEDSEDDVSSVATATAVENVVTRSAVDDLKTPGLFPVTTAHLHALASRYFMEEPISSGLLDLYVTFWRLDLQDIWTPEHVYTEQVKLITEDIKHIAAERKQQQAQRRSTAEEATIHRELDIMVHRLEDWRRTFEVELSVLTHHQERVRKTLRQRKHQWFQGHQSLTAFMRHMLAPRLLSSQKGALFCTKFIQMLVALDTENFYLVDFFNKWTGMLTPLVRSCSIQEADYLGSFVDEMASMVKQWVRQPSSLQQCLRDNRPCYARLLNRKGTVGQLHPSGPTSAISSDSNKTQLSQESVTAKDVEVLTPPGSASKSDPLLDVAELTKTIGKWENRIFRVIQHGLSLTEKETSWMAQRVVIKFLNTTHRNFPITDVAGSQILRALPALIERAKDARWDDVVANAKALDRNLRCVEPFWLKRLKDTAPDNEDESMRSSGSGAVAAPVEAPSTGAPGSRTVALDDATLIDRKTSDGLCASVSDERTAAALEKSHDTMSDAPLTSDSIEDVISGDTPMLPAQSAEGGKTHADVGSSVHLTSKGERSQGSRSSTSYPQAALSKRPYQQRDLESTQLGLQSTGNENMEEHAQPLNASSPMSSEMPSSALTPGPTKRLKTLAFETTPEANEHDIVMINMVDSATDSHSGGCHPGDPHESEPHVPPLPQPSLTCEPRTSDTTGPPPAPFDSSLCKNVLGPAHVVPPASLFPTLNDSAPLKPKIVSSLPESALYKATPRTEISETALGAKVPATVSSQAVKEGAGTRFIHPSSPSLKTNRSTVAAKPLESTAEAERPPPPTATRKTSKSTSQDKANDTRAHASPPKEFSTPTASQATLSGSETDQLVRVSATPEERKFEKQKEIDALRQRIKSLHTHRSKSSSSSSATLIASETSANGRSRQHHVGWDVTKPKSFVSKGENNAVHSVGSEDVEATSKSSRKQHSTRASLEKRAESRSHSKLREATGPSSGRHHWSSAENDQESRSTAVTASRISREKVSDDSASKRYQTHDAAAGSRRSRSSSGDNRRSSEHHRDGTSVTATGTHVAPSCTERRREYRVPSSTDPHEAPRPSRKDSAVGYPEDPSMNGESRASPSPSASSRKAKDKDGFHFLPPRERARGGLYDQGGTGTEGTGSNECSDVVLGSRSNSKPTGETPSSSSVSSRSSIKPILTPLSKSPTRSHRRGTASPATVKSKAFHLHHNTNNEGTSESERRAMTIVPGDSQHHDASSSEGLHHSGSSVYSSYVDDRYSQSYRFPSGSASSKESRRQLTEMLQSDDVEEGEQHEISDKPETLMMMGYSHRPLPPQGYRVGDRHPDHDDHSAQRLALRKRRNASPTDSSPSSYKDKSTTYDANLDTSDINAMRFQRPSPSLNHQNIMTSYHRRSSSSSSFSHGNNGSSLDESIHRHHSNTALAQAPSYDGSLQQHSTTEETGSHRDGQREHLGSSSRTYPFHADSHNSNDERDFYPSITSSSSSARRCHVSAYSHQHGVSTASTYTNSDEPPTNTGTGSSYHARPTRAHDGERHRSVITEYHQTIPEIDPHATTTSLYSRRPTTSHHMRADMLPYGKGSSPRYGGSPTRILETRRNTATSDSTEDYGRRSSGRSLRETHTAGTAEDSSDGPSIGRGTGHHHAYEDAVVREERGTMVAALALQQQQNADKRHQHSLQHNHQLSPSSSISASYRHHHREEEIADGPSTGSLRILGEGVESKPHHLLSTRRYDERVSSRRAVLAMAHHPGPGSPRSAVFSGTLRSSVSRNSTTTAPGGGRSLTRLERAQRADHEAPLNSTSTRHAQVMVYPLTTATSSTESVLSPLSQSHNHPRNANASRTVAAEDDILPSSTHAHRRATYLSGTGATFGGAQPSSHGAFTGSQTRSWMLGPPTSTRGRAREDTTCSPQTILTSGAASVIGRPSSNSRTSGAAIGERDSYSGMYASKR